MPLAKNVYIHADELENLPELNKKNYLFESKFLQQNLPQNASILQIGSMDGRRLFRLQKERPDLKLTGLEIEESLVENAVKNAEKNGLNIKFIKGDITDPPTLPHFDFVICLNNTLGYIPDQQKSIENMNKLGNSVILSVYGEKFSNELAIEYFKKLNLDIEKIEDDTFVMKNFTKIKRFSKAKITSWEGDIIDTPIGYLIYLSKKFHRDI